MPARAPFAPALDRGFDVFAATIIKSAIVDDHDDVGRGVRSRGCLRKSVPSFYRSGLDERSIFAVFAASAGAGCILRFADAEFRHGAVRSSISRPSI
jgi:hypothetical protein